jgi:hypothetical protein
MSRRPLALAQLRQPSLKRQSFIGDKRRDVGSAAPQLLAFAQPALESAAIPVRES